MESNFDSLLYYGTKGRWFSRHYTATLLIQTTASDLGLAHFTFRADISLYLSNMTNAKESIASLAHDFREDHISEAQFKSSLRDEWIPAIDAFISKWSKHLVPIDMRNAIDDVRRNIDLDPVVWPTLLCLSKNRDDTCSLAPVV